MPDSFEHTPTVAIRMPNGALTSLAGNVDAHHEVSVADLVLAQSAVRQTVEQLVRGLRAGCGRTIGHDLPARDGASAHRAHPLDATRGVCRRRRLRPEPRAAGMDAPGPRRARSCAGEDELTFRELLRALDQKRPLSSVAGLWFRDRDGFTQTPPRPVTAVEHDTIAPPKRSARVLSGYTMLGRQVDVIETSRGCTFDCSFCSIIEMRGRNFHRFPIRRVIADIADARRRGARAHASSSTTTSRWTSSASGRSARPSSTRVSPTWTTWCRG